MAELSLKATITEAMKAAMKAREKERLSAIRLILAEFKRIEVDERIDIDDARCLAVLDKMCKQRRDSIKQYEDAGRDELAAVEYAEIEVIQDFLPQALTEAELDELIAQAIAESGADSIKGMGQVMAILKPQIQGRADVGQVSQRVKSRLQ
ncbi:MAG TPA: glutamyl-tRNA amidotransferase [Spongiibacteraceae bacterium]|nr:glutamyl-tRNA amidotransferase [Spongiibacteraceae bacterium]HCS27853.1 glutamyl-tRNA amidotransferase [Spongiibacteraceae bacterium]|tara:strand:+ start:143 stop:595 length:453 start_codon:yes stop_codon:yes gene_type:complete